MKLSEMFEQAPEIEIEGLCLDSRQAKPNDIYFCMSGIMFDGHDFVEDVIAKGVKAIVHAKPIEHMYLVLQVRMEKVRLPVLFKMFIHIFTLAVISVRLQFAMVM